MYFANLLADHMFRGAPDIFWGVFTFVLGLLIVFGGMIVLVLVVSAVAKIMTARKAKKDAPETTEQTVTETNTEEVSEDGIPESVRVAVIAAVLAYYEGEGVKNEFVVKKIKKLNY